MVLQRSKIKCVLGKAGFCLMRMAFRMCSSKLCSSPTFVRRPHWIQKVLGTTPLANKKTMVSPALPGSLRLPSLKLFWSPIRKRQGAVDPASGNCTSVCITTSGLVPFFRARSSLGFPHFYGKLKQFVAASGREQTVTGSTPRTSRRPPAAIPGRCGLYPAPPTPPPTPSRPGGRPPGPPPRRPRQP